MSHPSGFQFVSGPAAVKAAVGIVACVPARVRSKQKLLAILADRLHFPGYFRHNWDALEEVLRDLSWLPPGPVTLMHSDLPFGPGGRNRGIYLAVLRSACRSWAGDPQRGFAVVFPAADAAAIDTALLAAGD